MPAKQALLLIGHGSTRYKQAGDILRGHAEVLRVAGHTVAVGFLNGAPTVAEALQAVAGAAARVVPFFMEDGYFTRTAIPRALAGASVRLCPPIGLHPAIPTIIERQALEACRDLGVAASDSAVLLVGHGSASAPGRPLALHDHAGRLAAGARFALVTSACLEEPPFVPDALSMLRAHPVIVVGYFANQGGHVRDDVPDLLAAEKDARGAACPPVRFAGNVTDDPAMAGLILAQAGYDVMEGA